MPHKETPVRRPSNFRKQAFFYYNQNRSFIMGSADTLQIKPVRGLEDNFVRQIIPWAIFVLLGVTIFSNTTDATAFIFPLLFIGTFIQIVTSIVYPQWRNRQVSQRFAQGTLIEGKVQSAVGVNSRNGRRRIFQVEVVFEFVTPSEALIVKRVKEPRRDLYNQRLPQPGAPLYILYFNDREYYLL